MTNKWLGRKEVGYSHFGRPRFIKGKKLLAKIGNTTYSSDNPRITEQYVKVLYERNVRIVTENLRGNVWFKKDGPCYVVMEDRNTGQVYSCKDKIQFTKINGGWKVEGNFVLGKHYVALPNPVPFSIWIGSDSFSVTTSSSSKSEPILKLDKWLEVVHK